MSYADELRVEMSRTVNTLRRRHGSTPDAVEEAAIGKTIAAVGSVDAVLADIGDEQDMRESLSTFSAHMANLAAIVAAAGPRTVAAR